MRGIFSCASPDGEISIPGSKSYSQRLILLSALFSIPVSLENISYSEDELRAISVASQCGMSVRNSGGRCMVSGKFRSPGKLFVGESATLFRLAAGGLAGKRETVEFRLSDSLLHRNHGDLLNALASNGVHFESIPRGFLMDASAAVTGPLSITGRISSQFVSSLIVMKASMGDFGSDVNVTNGLSSAGYVQITLDVMRKLGFEIASRTDNSFSVESFKPTDSVNVTLEGDFSSAAYFMVLAALKSAHGITLKGLNPNSLQPDRKMLDFLRQAGAGITTGTDYITIRESNLNGGTFEVDGCPDLALPLAVMSLFSRGKSEITGVSRLRYKETDRIESMIKLARSFGASAEYSGNSVTITPPDAIRAPDVLDFMEHRSIMAGIVASIASGSRVINQNVERISKSFPGFTGMLENVGCSIERV